MNRKMIFVMALMAALLMVPKLSAEQIRISGLVTNKDNAIIPGALVRVVGFASAVWTGRDGAYSLVVNLRSPAERAKILVHKKGYEVGEQERDLDAGLKRTYIVDFMIYFPGDVGASSFNEKKETLATVARHKDGLPDPPNFGLYTFDFKPVETKKEIRVYKGRTTLVEIQRKVKPPPPLPTTPPVPAGPPFEVLVTGRVQNSRGRPIGGASVFVPGRAMCTSDRKGRYKLVLRFARTVARANVTIVAQHKNFMKMQYPIQIVPSRDGEIRIPIKLPRYKGTLR